MAKNGATARSGKATLEPSKTAARKTSRAKAAQPIAGRRTGIPKSDGDAGVQAYIAGLPTWQADILRRIDRLIEREVPAVRKAIKWSSPIYGLEGRGWFAAASGFKSYVKLTFFRGSTLKPVPPSGAGKDMRAVDIREGEFDERSITAWVKQAAAMPGWGK